MESDDRYSEQEPQCSQSAPSEAEAYVGAPLITISPGALIDSRPLNDAVRIVGGVARRRRADAAEQVEAPERRVVHTVPGRHDAHREALAHAGEIRSTSDKVQQRFARGPINTLGISVEGRGELAVGQGLVGRTYFTTFEGRVLRYEVSYSTADKLQEIADCVFRAFNEPAGY